LFFSFLEAHWGTYQYGYLWLPGVEVTDQTMVASRYGSALLNFAPRLIGSPARGAGSFAAVGLNNTYSLLPLHCGRSRS